MNRSFITKLSATAIIGLFVLSIILGVCLWQRLYKNIFRLSSDQISLSLTEIGVKCRRIDECEIQPGDILLRRYITPRTWFVDKLASIYFTHAAFYLGDGYIVEAIGNEKNSEDEIRTIALSKSDWVNSDINNFIIIRPANYLGELELIKNNLRNISEDTDYIFGLPKKGHKRATCADLIFEQLYNTNIIQVVDPPRIITPDYLFWVIQNNSDSFEIVGYNIQQ